MENSYRLTINGEPEEPIILSQKEFDMICRLGISEEIFESSSKVEALTENHSNNETELTVDFATLQTVDSENFIFEGEKIEEQIAGLYFGRGFRKMITDTLESYKAKTEETESTDIEPI